MRRPVAGPARLGAPRLGRVAERSPGGPTALCPSAGGIVGSQVGAEAQGEPGDLGQRDGSRSQRRKLEPVPRRRAAAPQVEVVKAVAQAIHHAPLALGDRL